MGECISDSGCVITEFSEAGAACDDGNVCTLGDQCDEQGNCTIEEELSCDDANPCTLDLCDSDAGCDSTQLEAPGTSCDDGDPCTLDDACLDSGACEGSENECDDGIACTLNLCKPTNGECNNAVKQDGAGCKSEGDGNACTQNERCLNGICGCSNADTGSCPTFTTGNLIGQSNFDTVDCDDGKPCTHDYCEGGTGCVHDALGYMASCDDGDPCTTNTLCGPGGPDASCVGGTSVNSPDCGSPTSMYTCEDDGFLACEDEDEEYCSTQGEDAHLGAALICNGDPEFPGESDFCTCLFAGDDDYLCDGLDGNYQYSNPPTNTSPGLCINGPSQSDNPGTVDLKLDISSALYQGTFTLHVHTQGTGSCSAAPEVLEHFNGEPFQCTACPGTGDCVTGSDPCSTGAGSPSQHLTIRDVPIASLFNEITGTVGDHMYICARHHDPWGSAGSGASTGWIKVKQD